LKQNCRLCTHLTRQAPKTRYEGRVCDNTATGREYQKTSEETTPDRNRGRLLQARSVADLYAAPKGNWNATPTTACAEQRKRKREDCKPATIWRTTRSTTTETRPGCARRQRSATRRRKETEGRHATLPALVSETPRRRSGSRPGKGILNNARITRRGWMTFPLETLVERKFLGMSLQQVELRCTSNIVHYVLNEEHAEDKLLISNELK
jgi:hypothetical protein